MIGFGLLLLLHLARAEPQQPNSLCTKAKKVKSTAGRKRQRQQSSLEGGKRIEKSVGARFPRREGKREQLSRQTSASSAEVSIDDTHICSAPKPCIATVWTMYTLLKLYVERAVRLATLSSKVERRLANPEPRRPLRGPVEHDPFKSSSVGHVCCATEKDQRKLSGRRTETNLHRRRGTRKF